MGYLQRSKDWSEIVKNIIETLAFIVAAYWTYHIFGQKEAPSLEPVLGVDSSLELEKTMDPGIYQLFLDVAAENKGISSVDVAKIRVRAWQFENEIAEGEDINYLDIEDIETDGKRFFEATYHTTESPRDHKVYLPLIRHYPPKTIFNHTFQWRVNSKSINGWICFKVDLFENLGDEYPSWEAYSWDYLKPTQNGDSVEQKNK